MFELTKSLWIEVLSVTFIMRQGKKLTVGCKGDQPWIVEFPTEDEAQNTATALAEVYNAKTA